MTTPPRPEKRHHHTEHFGVKRNDPYGWLRNRDDPAVMAHLEAENAYSQALLAHTEELQQELYDEIIGRIKEDESSVPWSEKGLTRVVRTETGKAYPIHCVQSDGEERVILDENARAEGHDYYNRGSLVLDPKGTKLAWGEETSGNERFDVFTKTLFSDEATLVTQGVKWSLAWGGGGRHLFAVRPDHAERPWQVVRIDLNTGDETVVHEEPDERFFVSVRTSTDGEWILIDLQSKTTSEIWAIPSDDPTAPPVSVTGRRPEVEVHVDHHTDLGFIAAINDDGRTTFRLVHYTEPGAAPEELIACRDAITITDLHPFRSSVVLEVREDGLPAIEVLDVQSREQSFLDFPDAAFDASLSTNRDFDSPFVRVEYSSFRSPATIYDIDLSSGERTQRKQQEVRGGYDFSSLIVERLEAKAPDGTVVPISLVRHRDHPRPGRCLLSGYGAYGSTYDPRFSVAALSLVDRGFAYAVAHIRGGGDLGRTWYESGKLRKKQNSFTDFIACCDHLVDAGVAKRSELVIMGGSAGGLLMGAVLNQRPDVAAGCIAQVPFVDALTTMLDPSLPLTVIEYEEWGDPNTEEAFRDILAYSPIDNVEAQPYPPVFASAGINDQRVGYWEPAKWVATLRDHSTSEAPVLFHIELGAGHGGKSGRYGRVADVARMWAFAIDCVT